MSDWAKRILVFALASRFAFEIVRTVRTGELKVRRRVYLRSDDPITVWFHVIVYAVLVCGLLAGAARI